MPDSRYGNNEEELIRGCIARDHDAWESFLGRYSGLILTAIGNRLRKYGFSPNTHDIKEIQQIVLTSLWETGKLATLKDPQSLQYWLAAISGNMALDFMRKRGRIEHLAPVSLNKMLNGSELGGILPSPDRMTADELSRDELAGRIDEAIERLPVNEKLAIRLALLHGKKHAEVARIMGIPQGTAFSYIRKAKKKLRIFLADLQ